MALSSSLRKTATKLLGRFGGDVTISRVTVGSYNATTGAVSPTTSTTIVKGVLEDVREREVNDLIKGNDKKLTIAAADLSYEPTVTDQVTIGGRVLQVIQVDKIEQDNTAIVYQLFLRE